jgi:hypothetical protein
VLALLVGNPDMISKVISRCTILDEAYEVNVGG